MPGAAGALHDSSVALSQALEAWQRGRGRGPGFVHSTAAQQVFSTVPLLRHCDADSESAQLHSTAVRLAIAAGSGIVCAVQDPRTNALHGNASASFDYLSLGGGLHSLPGRGRTGRDRGTGSKIGIGIRTDIGREPTGGQRALHVTSSLKSVASAPLGGDAPFAGSIGPHVDSQLTPRRNSGSDSDSDSFSLGLPNPDAVSHRNAMHSSRGRSPEYRFAADVSPAGLVKAAAAGRGFARRRGHAELPFDADISASYGPQ